MILDNKIILITGGTGFLGRALAKYFCENYKGIKKLIVFSRDEHKQFLMSQEFSKENHPFIEYIIGDVRDRNRLIEVFEGVDYLIHAAAMKHVPISENNPTECIKTNIGGAENVIYAAKFNNISKIVALSTDKASSPINIYGATKLTSDKLFISANGKIANNDIKYSVVRFGNLMGSSDSVIPLFLKKKEQGFLPITDPKMTRFNTLLEEAVAMVIFALQNTWGGEILVPKTPSYQLKDLANAIAPNIEHRIIGVRQGEKIHEEMISSSDSYNTYDIGSYYSILPQITNWDLNKYIKHFNAQKVEEGFIYSSLNNKELLTVEELKNLIVNLNK
ncbi:MAG: UDP-N-acetylglucosamine 4,6-dehydratase (inverting) [Solirubrobacteraceae bacterium]